VLLERNGLGWLVYTVKVGSGNIDDLRALLFI
jgi:hypothetical protein